MQPIDRGKARCDGKRVALRVGPWRFLQRTEASQKTAFESSAEIQKDVTYFTEKIGSITRRLRSDIASTSSTIRRSRSPRLNAGSPAGARGISRS